MSCLCLISFLKENNLMKSIIEKNKKKVDSIIIISLLMCFFSCIIRICFVNFYLVVINIKVSNMSS